MKKEKEKKSKVERIKHDGFLFKLREKEIIGKYAVLTGVDSSVLEDSVVIVPKNVGRFPVKYIGAHSFSRDGEHNKFATIVLQEGIERIEDGAFALCTHLKRIIIPDSINRIAEDAFPENNEITLLWSGNNENVYMKHYIEENNERYDFEINELKPVQ